MIITDVMGPYTPEALRVFKDACNITDECTGSTEIYVLKTEDGACHAFQPFVQSITSGGGSNDPGLIGREFIGIYLNGYCHQMNVLLEYAAPICCRKNRPIRAHRENAPSHSPVRSRRQQYINLSLGVTHVHGSVSCEQKTAFRAWRAISAQYTTGDGTRSTASLRHESGAFRAYRAAHRNIRWEGRTIWGLQ